MNFTVATHGKKKDATGYLHYEDVDFSDIPAMVTHGLNYCACKLKNEYRLDDNFDGHVDVLIIDVDEICTIKMAVEIFARYQFYLITSKSHQKEKGGLVCDRFRLFIPLDKTVYIRQEMEEIYNRFIGKYDFIDKSCRNVSRFFYSSPKDAEIIYNDGKKYKTYLSERLDDIVLTHDKKEEVVEYAPARKTGWLKRPDNVVVEYEYSSATTEENYLKGIESYMDENYYQGNKGNCLFNAACMMMKDGFDDDYIANHLIAEWTKRGSSTDRLADCMANIKGAFKLR